MTWIWSTLDSRLSVARIEQRRGVGVVTTLYALAARAILVQHRIHVPGPSQDEKQKLFWSGQPTGPGRPQASA